MADMQQNAGDRRYGGNTTAEHLQNFAGPVSG
jgi:hypothetical protein